MADIGRWQFVILAGGLGTRLYPITEKVPKPIVDVAGLPYLTWQLKELKAQGARQVLLLTGHLGEQIEKVFGNGHGLGLDISYSKEPMPLGTGGALQLALPKLDSKFVLLNGDSFLPMKFSELIESDFPATIAAYTNAPATPVPNNLKVHTDKNSPERRPAVVSYQKNGGLQQGYTHVDAGIYLIQRELIETCRTSPPFALETLWPDLILKKQLGIHVVSQRFFDIGTPERLKEFEEFVHDHFKDTVSGQLHGRGHRPS